MFIEFINEYGTTIIYTLLTAFAGYIGLWIKSLYTKYINDKTKKDVVRTCVQAVEQLYKDLHGEAKYNEVVVSASEMLALKGITISELEIKMLIEAAVAEFNDAFNKGGAGPGAVEEANQADSVVEDEAVDEEIVEESTETEVENNGSYCWS